MTAITLKKLPDELHWEVKSLQLEYEKRGIKKKLEEIYIEAIEIGLQILKKKVEEMKKEKPAK